MRKNISGILLSLDNNQKGDTFAVLAAMIDRKQAFPRQDPTLGVQSFINSGVCGTLIPLLVNYFEDRVMSVKWHQTLSSTRNLPGGGPQGGISVSVQWQCWSHWSRAKIQVAGWSHCTGSDKPTYSRNLLLQPEGSCSKWYPSAQWVYR